MRTTWADTQLATGLTGEAVRAGFRFRTHRRLMKADPAYREMQKRVYLGLLGTTLAIAGMAVSGYLVSISTSAVFKAIGTVLLLSFLLPLAVLLFLTAENSQWIEDGLRVTLELERNKETRL